MKTTEAFEKWAENEVRPYGPDEMRVARAAFLAGAAHGKAAEREAVLAIIGAAFVDPPNYSAGKHDAFSLGVLKTRKEIERRIRARAEEEGGDEK